MKTALFSNSPQRLEAVYGAGRRERLAGETDLLPEIVTQENFTRLAPRLAEVEAIFCTWGMFSFSEENFRCMPNLRAVFHAAGATDAFARPFLRRDIALFSAWQANAVPVAEFAVAQIMLSMKGYFRNTRGVNSPEGWRAKVDAPGAFGETVGLIGDGAIAQRVRAELERHDLSVLMMHSKPAERVISLEELFRRAYVVSNHLPDRDDNKKIITGDHFRSMRPGAAFVNTGRGGQVDEEAMIEVLRERPDITALLDVTEPEPPVPGSPLYTLPNVWLSSHIAGAQHQEWLRLADWMLDEFTRWRRGDSLRYRVYESMLITS